jgi:hypothetical protein
MAIAVYFHPKGMSLDQYNEVHKRLEANGAGLRNQRGRLHHSCFGEDGDLMVYDVWESQAAFEAFGKTLMPILAEVGVDAGQPAVMPIHGLDQDRVEGSLG